MLPTRSSNSGRATPPHRGHPIPGLLLLTVAVLAASVANAAGNELPLRVDGPYLLHANVCWLWGGHTFSYALLGERHLFWGATLNRPTPGPQDEAFPIYIRQQYNTCVVGQFPLSGASGTLAIQTLEVKEEGVAAASEPLLFRTPDGYLHMIRGVIEYRPKPTPILPGRIRYYRSVRPEDVTEWLDRSELIPRQPFGAFHLRMNVAVTPDGERAALAVLAVSEDGSVAFNTPVIFLGHRQGLDFHFAPAVQYHEPMGFFYPQIAALSDSIVMVGEVWDVADHATSRLVHLDWSGKVIHEEDLPSDPTPGQYLSFDMRPAVPGRWDELVIYHNMNPQSGPWRHLFFQYSVGEHKLRLIGELTTEYGKSNAGKWLSLGLPYPVFVHNPCLGALHAWYGDFGSASGAHFAPVPGADPIALGFQGCYYIVTPNPLQGSVCRPEEVYVMTDAPAAGKSQSDRGPCSLLLWRLRRQP